MLLIEPPVRKDKWLLARREKWNLSRNFGSYCAKYVDTVLGLSWERLEPLLEQLTRGFDHQPLTSEVVHRMVDHQWQETNYEASGKVARIILLHAFVRSVESEGVGVLPATERLLKKCDELVPLLLMIAVDDHFGFLEV